MTTRDSEPLQTELAARQKQRQAQEIVEQTRGAADGLLALKLFDSTFGASWAPWRAWLCAVLGLPMTDAEAAIFRECTARQALPTGPAREVWCAVGRRGGKSRAAVLLLVFLACFRRYILAPGERAVALCIAADRKQSRVLFSYALALLQSVPALAAMIVRQTADTIDLSTGVSIEITTASFRSPRGYTIVGCVIDEVAFLSVDDSANPDTEIIRAIRPSLASVPGSVLVCISSPYAMKGELFKHHERYYGRDSDVLVWQAATRTMNATIPQAVVDRALDDDVDAASAEWLGLFRSDLESLFAREALDAVIVRGRRELAPVPGVAYTGFVDPSGGSADAFSLAIAHRSPSGVPVLDLVREVKPPFSPEAVTLEFSRTLKAYNVSTVIGDAYAGEWPREQFRKHGIAYQTSELNRSALYLELLPTVNSGAIELLDNSRLLGQLAGLERRTGRSGKDSIDHRRGGHDDLSNSACGALVHAERSNDYATLPADFLWCNRKASMPDFRMETCYLFKGAFKPPADICCSNCEGHKFVRAAHRAFEERGGEHMGFVQFYRERIQPNDLVARVLANRWADAQGI